MQMMVANFPFLGAFCNYYRGQPARKLREFSGVKIHNSYFVKDPNLNDVQTILETPKVEIFEISGGDELNIPNFFIDSWTQNPGSHVLIVSPRCARHNSASNYDSTCKTPTSFGRSSGISKVVASPQEVV